LFYVLTWDGAKFTVAHRERLGYWFQGYERDRTKLLRVIDLDGDGTDEIIYPYDSCYVEMGGYCIRERLYKWNGSDYEIVWDEEVEGGSNGARSKYAYAYKAGVNFVRDENGALVILLFGTEEIQGDSGEWRLKR